MTRAGVSLVVVTVLAGAAACGGGRSARIREIKADEAAECRYLGIVEAADRSGWTMADDQLGAMSTIRRLVAEKEGNAFVLTHEQGVKYAPAVRADVYRCR